MKKLNKELIVVGDRVLVRAEEGEERTNVGLYLPPTAVDSQAVQGGTIVATGPGLPMPALDANSEEPWQTQSRETRFIPMQAKRGDFALFFRKALDNPIKPDLLTTVFAGQDAEATERARSYFTGYPPSSPSISLMKDGKLVFMLERFQIEGRPAEEIAHDLINAFNRYCA